MGCLEQEGGVVDSLQYPFAAQADVGSLALSFELEGKALGGVANTQGTQFAADNPVLNLLLLLDMVQLQVALSVMGKFSRCIGTFLYQQMYTYSGLGQIIHLCTKWQDDSEVKKNKKFSHTSAYSLSRLKARPM